MAKKIIFIITIWFLVFGLGFVVINKYFSLPKEEPKKEQLVVTGTVLEIGINNFIIKDENNMLYSITYNQLDINMGDKVNVYSKDGILEVYPAIVLASKIEIIEKVTSGQNNEENKLTDDKPTDDISSSNNENKVNTIKTEKNVIDYFIEVDDELDKKTVGENVKTAFVSIVDFLFYDGEILGYRFNELTESAKLQVLKISSSIDKKIDSVFPGYKETIGKGTNRVYTEIKGRIIEKYLDITVTICKKDQNICNQAKQDFQDMKKSFSLTWDFLIHLAKGSVNKINDWYIIWREN